MLNEVVRRIRRNHALEHATVTLMLERGVSPPIGGYSTPGGFFIVGSLPTDELAQIVAEALDRLNAGQRDLAVSPHCGTNMATGALITGLLTRVVALRGRMSRRKRLPLVIAAVVAGGLLSKPIGSAIQRRYTTLADMDGLEVVGIRKAWPGERPRLHRVSTRIPAAEAN